MSEKQPTMNINGLFLEEVFTDRAVGTIRRLSPVTADGAPDKTREVIYAGSAQMMTAAGPLPLNFEIDAASLQDAAEKFTQFAELAMRETIRELQELRREQASSIVLPGESRGGMGGGMGSGLLGGGIPGGGKRR